MTTTIKVDYEHNCEEWWDNAQSGDYGKPPGVCAALLERDCDEMTVANQAADEFLAWAIQIPGWDEEPFVIEEAAEDSI